MQVRCARPLVPVSRRANLCQATDYAFPEKMPGSVERSLGPQIAWSAG